MASQLLEKHGSKFINAKEVCPASPSSESTVIYSTLDEAIQHHLEDPQSNAKLDFIARAYGCDPQVLITDAGLSPLLHLYQEGRMVSAVKSHALLVDPYNMTDVIMSGQIMQETGIPTAILAVTYSEDKFISSPEKTALFGAQRYLVGYNEKGKPLFNSVQIKPTGIRKYSSEGGEIITPINNIDHAVGVPLKDIMVQIEEPIDPRGTKAQLTDDEKREQYIEAALGINWQQILNHPCLGDAAGKGYISVSDLHKVLFEETVNRLRMQGALPSQQDMPIVHGELGTISKAILKHATYVPETTQTLGFEGPAEQILTDTLCIQPSTIQKIDVYLKTLDESLLSEIEAEIPVHNESPTEAEIESLRQLGQENLNQICSFIMGKKGLSFHEKSGLLANGEHADPASYYPLFQALLCHDYCELDGSDVDHYFSRKVQRAQALQTAHGLPITIIRTPADEVVTQDNSNFIKPFVATRLHPTGKYFDITAANGHIAQQVILPLRQQEINGKKLSKAEQSAVEARLQQIKKAELAKVFLAVQESVENGTSAEWQRTTEAIATDEVMQWWIQMIATLPDELKI
ncbi:hypothetical protein KAZ66_03645 [Candidatus Woesebacteria bacterium]|nr:hypothetical protein [Candidatus Woesebacteria bacterium]